jgi:hypothetical protein
MRHRLGLKYLVSITTVLTALLSGAVNATEPRFVPLDSNGKALTTEQRRQLQEWPCVRDQHSGLLWEGKSRQAGLHFHDNTYNWFSSDHRRNGGLAGEPSGRDCRDGSQQQACDTQRFIDAVNKEKLCGQSDWRLPTREELRSLVDYRARYPGPAIDTRAFPNQRALFYWSANSKASEPLEAWGIGFAFGFDYAYFKSNKVHARLVSGAAPEVANK